MIIVDSSVWIDFFNGYPSPEKEKLKTLLESHEVIAIIGIIATEVLSGFKSQEIFDEVKSIFQKLYSISLQYNHYTQAAEIYRNLRSNGITIRSLIDCLIANVAMENSFYLLSKDRDFKMIQRYYPSLKFV